MGTVTDMALSLARQIVSNQKGINDVHMLTWWRGQISGALLLALELDSDAAWEALPQFDAMRAQLKTVGSEP